MVDAGTKVSDETITMHKEVKEKKRFAAIYHIDGAKGVTPLKAYPESADKKVADDIPSYETFEKNVFKQIYDEIIKCPDKAKVKDKMVAASTFGSLAGKLDGTKKLQVNDAAGLEYATLCNTAFSGEKN